DGVVHGILAARKNGRDAGANWTFSDLQLAFSRDQRSVADQHTADVGDGIEFSWRTVKRDSEVAGAWLLCGVRLCQRNQRGNEKKKQHERNMGTMAHSDFFLRIGIRNKNGMNRTSVAYLRNGT